MITRSNLFWGVAWFLAALLVLAPVPPSAHGQELDPDIELDDEPLVEDEGIADIEEPSVTYEGIGEVDVRNENYVRGRERAVVEAWRSSLDEALRDMLGEPVYQANTKTLSPLYKHPRKFIRSYRFLSTLDDEVEKISRVKLEVQFYKEALNRELNSLGVLAALVKPKTVLVLIVEKSVSFEVPHDFWDTVPMAEVALYTHLLGQGVEVIKREDVLDKIPQNLVLQAVGGDLNATVEIGLKASADVVIVGSALSSVVGVNQETGLKTVQANLNFRAISSVQATIIAAKSDLATVMVEQEMDGELQAFEKVSQKAVGFLVDALGRYWAPTQKVVQNDDTQNETTGDNETQPESAPDPEPTQPVKVPPSNLPPNMGDL